MAQQRPPAATGLPRKLEDLEPLVHLQREWIGTGNALCGAPADPTNVPVDLVIANPGAVMGMRLCAKCVSRFHRIGSGGASRAERSR